MDKPISVGDLVVIVKPLDCCGFSGSLGEYHIVAPDSDRMPFARCTHCGDVHEHSAATSVRLENAHYSMRHRLKRIPPLDELGGLESEEADKLPPQRMIEAAERYKRLVTSK